MESTELMEYTGWSTGFADSVGCVLFYVAIFVGFYFFVIRPLQKKYGVCRCRCKGFEFKKETDYGVPCLRDLTPGEPARYLDDE